jgi:hypothetical protein
MSIHHDGIRFQEGGREAVGPRKRGLRVEDSCRNKAADIP